MMNEDWGLTERGFHRPTYTELLDAIEYKARDMFGAQANMTVRSPLGIFLRIFAWLVNILFMLLEDIYNSQFIDTAVGTSLYNLGRAVGMRLLEASKASGYLLVTGSPGIEIPAGWLVSTVEGMQYLVAAGGTIGSDGTALVPIQAAVVGADGNAAAGTVTRIVNILSGVQSITNPQDITGGRARESDEEFRDRYYKSVDTAGGVNADAIRGALLQDVPGIASALVYENDTDEPDANGRPPHSLESIVFGGSDSDIAMAIFKRKGGGIQTHGTTAVAVISASGQTVEIRFSRPSAVPVWVRVSDLVTGDGFPSDGVERIKAALMSYIGSSVKGGLSIGTGIVFNRLPSVVYGVPGVEDFALEISTDGVDFGTSNIAVGTREKAVTDESKVTVS